VRIRISGPTCTDGITHCGQTHPKPKNSQSPACDMIGYQEVYCAIIKSVHSKRGLFFTFDLGSRDPVRKSGYSRVIHVKSHSILTAPERRSLCLPCMGAKVVREHTLCAR
ncbi:hypothetical protein GcC1_079030, partial [Golovinomyces cichoracearum]